MYTVTKQIHPKHGNVICIAADEAGEYYNPFVAYNQAKLLRRLWLENEGGKVRVLIDSQVMTIAQAEKWSHEEYKNLPKCQECGKILGGQVYTHRLCPSGLFCTPSCSNHHYMAQAEKLSEEEEIDYL